MKILMIVDHPNMAHNLQQGIDPTKKHFRVAPLGAQLAGCRFDRVLIHPSADIILNHSGEAALDMLHDKAQAWFRDVVQCRLTPEGLVVRL